MTVSSDLSRADYDGNGVTVAFPVPFRFLLNTDLRVIRTVIASGVETVLTLDSLGVDGYSVTGAGQPNGGSVTVVTAPVGAGDLQEKITILCEPPITQLTDYIANDPFSAETHERALDKLTMVVRAHRERLERTIRLPDSSSGVVTVLPHPEPLAVLGWNQFGDQLQNTPISTFVAGATAGAQFTYNVTDGDTEVDFSTMPSPWAPMGVFYNGVFQAPSAFDIVGNKVVFTEALPAPGIVSILAVFTGPGQLNESHQLTYTLQATGAVSRTQRDKNAESVSVKDFGAMGDGTTDDTIAIQKAIDQVFTTGGELFFPAGRYRTTAELYLDVRGVTGAPNTNVRRVNFRGAGKGNTVILPATDSITALHIQGDNPITSASHAYITISDLAFGGNSPTQRTCTGIKLEDLAYLAVRDVSFHSLAVGMNLDGCLSSTFDSIIFNESAKGVVADASASGPHSNLWLGCEFRNITALGYDGYSSLSGLSFVNCRFEACGTAGDAATGAVSQSTSGTAGEHGMSFLNCYIEGNRGGFDIKLNETGSQRVTLNLTGCCFNRTSSTNFTTNNVVTTGDVDLNIQGCTFTSYNTYVPNVARPYLSQSSSTRLRDLGNRYEDAVEAPVLGQSLPYAGFVAGSLGAAVTGTLPNGWTVSQVSAGLFQVTHNIGHTDYAVNATVNSTSNRVVERCVRQTNSFQVKVTNTANVNTDDDFSFTLNVLKPTK